MLLFLRSLRQISKHLTFVEQICKYMLCSGLKIDEKITQLIANSTFKQDITQKHHMALIGLLMVIIGFMSRLHERWYGYRQNNYTQRYNSERYY